MSEYREVKTKINDQEMLRRTLIDLGCPESSIQIHDRPVALDGYYGRNNTRHAEVVVKKGPVSQYDIGFARGHDGMFEAYVNDMERGKFAQDVQGKRLRIIYDKNVSVKVAKEEGWLIEDMVEEEDRVRIVVRR